MDPPGVGGLGQRTKAGSQIKDTPERLEVL